MRTEKKQQLRQLRHWRIRKKVGGTKDRPRMSVCFTNENIHVQFIDDVAGRTLAAASTMSKNVPDRDSLAANVNSAKVVGRLAAEAALARGIKEVVFDRGGMRYHWSKGKDKDGKPAKTLGKLATLAEAAREAGLKF
ncbi:MAG TPA: 50S ribosomal protein L18 [Verrucomicrobiae bacterium]|nr:50S ribosomal protein L18 [Verrucomicrobiae bacterium]